MNEFALMCILIILVFALSGCLAVSKAKGDNEKFTMNGSVAIGAVDDNNLDRIKISYNVIISGNK